MEPQQPKAGPLPSEVFVADTFAAFSNVMKPRVAKGQNEAYYYALYLEWTKPTEAEENQPYASKAAGDYFEKMARVYVWPTLWQMFAGRLQS